MNQKTVFKKISDKSTKCYVCWWSKKDPFGNPTRDFYPFMFAHVLAKWIYKKFKFTEENIKFVC